MTNITCGDFIAIAASHNRRVTHKHVRQACRKLNIRFEVDPVGDNPRKGVWKFSSKEDLQKLLNYFHVNTWENPKDDTVLSKYGWENFECKQ